MPDLVPNDDASDEVWDAYVKEMRHHAFKKGREVGLRLLDAILEFGSFAFEGSEEAMHDLLDVLAGALDMPTLEEVRKEAEGGNSHD